MKRFLQRDFRDTNPSMGKAMLFGFLAVMVAIAITGYFNKAKAAEPWTGCHAGIFGSYVTASAIQDGSPVGFASNGQVAGFAGGCDKQFGQTVVGAEASYGWVFGNLGDLGVDNQLSITGRAGYLLNNDVLLYGHGGWTRVSGSGMPDVDGYLAGAGGEFRLPGSAMFLDVRWTHTFLNEGDIGAPSTVNLSSDEFRVGLKIKFGASVLEDPKPASSAKAKKLSP